MEPTASTTDRGAGDAGLRYHRSHSCRSVMLIEDQPALRECLSWRLRALKGYAPLIAFSRSQALAWIAAAAPWERIPDVVLIDVSIPNPALAALMEALPAGLTEAGRTPVMIGMTTMPKERYPHLPGGLQAMLYKPFPFQLLRSLLSDYLDTVGSSLPEPRP
jgi:CheY-like chemotaxis protein